MPTNLVRRLPTLTGVLGRSLLVGALSLTALGGSLGCASVSHGRQLPPPGPIDAAQIDEAAFAGTVHGLLREGRPTADRQAKLAGVVRRQLAHAHERLRQKQRERGVASVVGALYLVRAGELRPEMVDQTGEQALAMAVDVLSAMGDDGRASALYELRKMALPAGSPQVADIDEHLKALTTWSGELEKKPGIGRPEAAGLEQRRKTARALLLPSDAAVRDAIEATERWIEAALVLQQESQRAKTEEAKSRPRQEDMVEAYRGMVAGAATAAALYLRHGDAEGGSAAMRMGALSQVAPAGLVHRLDGATRHPEDARPWRELTELYTRSEGREEDSVDRSLMQAAAFGAGIEAYRRDPTAPEIALHLSVALVAYGMPEVAPLVLRDAADKHADPALLSMMLDFLVNTMVREEAADDPASARRMFAAAGPLLDTIERKGLKGRVQPSPSRCRVVAAGIDARVGELSGARAQLQRAIADEPAADASKLLAEVDRQLGDLGAAMAQLREVARSPEARRDRLIEADARLTLADLLRESGKRDEAKGELGAALSAVLEVRAKATGAQAARAERLLARVLDRFGDGAAAERATERAIIASKGDARQLSLALLEALSRAYVARDVKAARKVAQHALGARLRDDELVYLGLWLSLLEKELGGRSDGLAARLLATVEPGPSWSGRLASWANGKLSDDALTAAARTPSQRVEALFYKALSQRAQGKAASADGALREVVKAQTLDLMEAQIARDLLAGNDRTLGGLPNNVVVP